MKGFAVMKLFQKIKFVYALLRELKRAEAKHGLFAHVLNTRDLHTETRDLKWARFYLREEIARGCVGALTVIECELCEAREASAKNDLEATRAELVQTAVTCMRAAAMVDEMRERELERMSTTVLTKGATRRMQKQLPSPGGGGGAHIVRETPMG